MMNPRHLSRHPQEEDLGDARVVLIGGEPLGPRHIWWNLVSSRRACVGRL
jgi:hypothetical protein